MAADPPERSAATLLDSLPGFAHRSRLDASRTMLWMSRGVRETTGYAPAALVRNVELAYVELIHPEDRSRLRDELTGAAERDEPFQVRYRIRTRQGEVRWMREQGRVVGSAADGSARLCAYVFDVTQEERRAAEQRSRRRRLERLSRGLLEVQERERRRLSHELHDSLAQQLIGARMALGTGAGRSSPDEARRKLRHADELLDEVIGRVRSLSAGLRPVVLDDLGLEAALEHHVQRVEEIHDLEVRLQVALRGHRYPVGLEAACYRIVQEALANTVLHADAGTAIVRVAEEDGALRIRVSDDGIGFDPSTIEPRNSGAGLGLLAMEERARSLGGELDLASERGGGTVVEVRLPVSRGG